MKEFQCNVEGCTDIVSERWRSICARHHDIKRHHGTPLPEVTCFGCNVKFIYTKAFRNRMYCKACIELFKKYDYLVTKPVIRQASSHGIRVIQYIKLVVAQDFKCATCKREIQKFYIDHDHSCCQGGFSCGKCVRGLLCNTCNVVLGAWESNPGLFDSFADYVASSPIDLRRNYIGAHNGRNTATKEQACEKTMKYYKAKVALEHSVVDQMLGMK